MNMNLLGRWRNEYGSTLDIQSQAPNGSLIGIYASDTGASGTYSMNGWSPDEPLGSQTVSVSVFWKPEDTSQPDPSWNWVSTMSGVLFLDTPDLQPVIQFLHGMVASTPFEAVQVYRPGVYTEALTFRREGVKVPDGSHVYSIPRGGRSLKRAVITLTNTNPLSRYASIELTYDATGQCVGVIAGSEVALQGFVDPNPPANLQSTALTGLFTAGRVFSFGFGGFIDLQASSAVLDLFESDAVTYSNKYAAVAVSQERFTVAIKRITHN